MSKHVNMVRYSVELSPELAEKFEEMAKQEHASRSDIFRKALFLMHVAINSKKKGREIAVVDQSGYKVSDIIL
ncbi:MAG: hypothetical protein K0R24_2092 [Gammaproteobacteria bacterium]|jgi:metal-responsive CopG/Arc/MetJ family transcriptional regulator|nr:hypothetical protein [Gammaproteobacteria bacterium]MCE3239111.1 hypothetical protein [Gammaproteobacteria bacterium]